VRACGRVCMYCWCVCICMCIHVRACVSVVWICSGACAVLACLRARVFVCVSAYVRACVCVSACVRELGFGWVVDNQDIRTCLIACLPVLYVNNGYLKIKNCQANKQLIILFKDKIKFAFIVVN